MLPEKWYIKRTPIIASIVNKWFNEKLLTSYSSQHGILYYPAFHGAQAKDAITQGYKEITFEQFSVLLNQPTSDYQIF